jgi:hypothetical protein
VASAATRVKNKIREQTPNFFLLINRKKEGKEKGGTETTIMVRGKDGF